jgi:competence protein ComEC
MSTGTIIQHAAAGRYEFQLHDGSRRWLRTDESFDPGDILFVTANVKSVTTLPTLRSWNTQIWSWSDLVRGSGIEFDYPRRLVMKWLCWDLYLQSAIILHSQHEWSWILDIRKTIHTALSTALHQSQTSALTEWMLIGDRSGLTRDEYQLFIDSWLVHLIAVSGGNIVMLVVFLMMILCWLPFYMRITVVLCGVIWYALICGLDSSVLRATIMGSLSLLALIFGRQIELWRSIQLAWMSMLLLNPYLLVYDVGFLLSFAAVIGLVILTPRMTLSTSDKHSPKQQQIRSSWFLSWVWRQALQGMIAIRNWYLVPSIAATIGVFPVLMLFMWSINLAGIIANLFVVPLIPLIMINGIILALGSGLSFLFPFVYLQNILVWYVFQVAMLTSQYGVYIDVYSWWFKILIVIVFVWWWWRSSIKQQAL